MRNKTKFLIIGAGVGGLSCASWLKHYGEDFMVVEGNNGLPKNLHNGVHYLHSIPEVPFQIDFKEMTLTDGILTNGRIHHQPNLQYSLTYSEKVREIQHPSSIMDVGKMDSVYMPKSNSLNELIEEMYNFADHDNFFFRYFLKFIDTNAKIAEFEKDGEKFFVEYETIISTIPLDKLYTMIAVPEEIKDIKLACAPVYITNYKVEKIVPNWLINLYIPDPETPIYRVSILNGIASVESIREMSHEEKDDSRWLLSGMFHIVDEEPTSYTWNTGKVLSISIDDRTKVVESLKKMSIIPIGRFGLWNRKLLIDTTIKQARAVAEWNASILSDSSLVEKLSK